MSEASEPVSSGGCRTVIDMVLSWGDAFFVALCDSDEVCGWEISLDEPVDLERFVELKANYEAAHARRASMTTPAQQPDTFSKTKSARRLS